MEQLRVIKYIGLAVAALFFEKLGGYFISFLEKQHGRA